MHYIVLVFCLLFAFSLCMRNNVADIASPSKHTADDETEVETVSSFDAFNDSNRAVGALRSVCMEHEHLEKLLPSSKYGNFAVRMATGDGNALAINHANVKELDLVVTATVDMSDDGLTGTFSIQGSRPCSVTKAAQDSACIVADLEDLTLPGYLTRSRLNIRAAVKASGGFRLKKRVTQRKSKKLVDADAASYKARITDMKLNVRVDELQALGRTTDLIASGFVNSRLTTFLVRKILVRVLKKSLELNAAQAELLNQQAIGPISFSFRLTPCDTQTPKVEVDGLCLATVFSGDVDIHSGRLMDSISRSIALQTQSSLNASSLQMLAIWPALLMRNLDSLTVSVNVGSQNRSHGLELTTRGDLGLQMSMKEILTAARDSLQHHLRQMGKSSREASAEKTRNKDVFEFQIPIDTDQSFFLGIQNPYVSIAGLVRARVVRLAKGLVPGPVIHLALGDDKPVTLSVRTTHLRCELLTPFFKFDICGMLGNSLDMLELNLRGSIYISGDGRFLTCLGPSAHNIAGENDDVDPCAERTQIELRLRTPHIERFEFQKEGDLSMLVNLGALLQPVTELQRQQLLKESLTGESLDLSPKEKAGPNGGGDPADKAIQKTIAESDQCGMGLSAIVAKDLPGAWARLKHAGEECFQPSLLDSKCNRKAGFCEWCGIGHACCRKGWAGDPEECSFVKNFSREGKHICVTPENLAPLVSGEDCWSRCGSRHGFCPSCGPNKACCRKGDKGSPAECMHAEFSTDKHSVCVDVVASKWDIHQKSWTPGEPKMRKDQARIEELSKHPEVLSKRNKLFFRSDDDPTGGIEVFSYSALGVDADISLFVRRPVLRAGSEDVEWFQRVGVDGAKVAWIVELGGEQQGASASVRALAKDFWISRPEINLPLKLVQDKDGVIAVFCEIRMRFVLSTDGQIKGCFGTCCSDSVEVSHVKLEHSWLLSQIVKLGQGVIGSFIPELLGHLLPNLIELPLTMLMGSKYDKPALETEEEASAITVKVKLRYDLATNAISVNLKPSVGPFELFQDKAGNLGWLPDIGWDYKGLLTIAIGASPIKTRLQSYVGPILERCASIPYSRDSTCFMSAVVPLTIEHDPIKNRLTLDVHGLQVKAPISDLMFAINHFLAQPELVGQQEKQHLDMCLIGLDDDDALNDIARRHDEFSPFTRITSFGLPVDLDNHVKLLTGKAEFSMLRRSEERHRIHIATPLRVHVADVDGILRPHLNDAGVADFGFMHFRGEGFYTLKKKKSWSGSRYQGRSKPGAVALRCGDLSMGWDRLVDLSAEGIKVSRSTVKDEKGQAHCVTVSQASNPVHSLCHDDLEQTSTLHNALEKEVARQAVLRRQVKVDGCYLPSDWQTDPLSTQTVTAWPSKRGAFRWSVLGKPVEKLDNDAELLKCIEQCASNPVCNTVTWGEHDCLFAAEYSFIFYGEHDDRRSFKKLWSPPLAV